jgi:probable rRNA maturation factor
VRPKRPAPRRPSSPATRGLQIDIAWRLRTGWRAVALLQRVARHAAAASGFRTGQLSVAVVGAAAMAALHQRFMGEAGPTDVLTFDLGSHLPAGRLDAEIVLCADIARRAGTLNAARAELALYLVHGVLHLAGYDDHNTRSAARMHAREDELLQQLGLGAVFRTGAMAALQVR